MKEWIVRDTLNNKYVQELVRCKDCKHRPKDPNYIEFPEGSKCPCQCSGDEYYSWYPEDDWFCPNGKRRDDGDDR